MTTNKRVAFMLDTEVAEDLEVLARLVGIRQYKGRLVNLLLQRGLRQYKPAIARFRNGTYGQELLIREALVAEVDAQ